MIELIARLKARFIAPRQTWQNVGVGAHQFGMYRVKEYGEGFASVFICNYYIGNFPSVAKAKRYCEKDHHAMNRIASTVKVPRHDR